MNEFLLSTFHFLFNTFLIFFVLSIFVELMIFCFRIKKSRVKTFLRFLPVVKLPVDIILFKLFHLSLFFNLNPFHCEQRLFNYFNKTFPIKIFELKIFWIICLVTLAVLSLISLIRKFISILSCRRYLKRILQSSKPCTRELINSELKNRVSKLGAKIVVSEHVQIAFATFSAYIALPHRLIEKLSQEEFEAVVAHEIEHLRWKDPLAKVLSHCIAALFWWIPLQWWLKRLNLDQEEASDQALAKYKIDPGSLASAIVKSLADVKAQKAQNILVCHMATEENVHVSRVKNLLNVKRAPLFNPHYANTIIAFSLCTFLFLSWWVC